MERLRRGVAGDFLDGDVVWIKVLMAADEVELLAPPKTAEI